MNVIETAIPEVLILEPRVFKDERGFFLESYNGQTFTKATGLSPNFVQDNHSCSNRYVLRGLHYQIQQPQGKLVRVVRGEVFDVAVDLRQDSATFGQWVGCILNEENKRLFWIPEGFAHGFLVLSDIAEFLYKATNYYAPQYERTLLWNDPDVGIEWTSIPEAPILSNKDLLGSSLKTAETFVKRETNLGTNFPKLI